MRRNLAVGNNVATPTDISVVKTTRGQAVALTGAGNSVRTDEPSYVVQMTGNFVGRKAKVPAGQAAPRGSALTVTIDAATGTVSDWSIGDSRQNLSLLGTVSTVSQ
jgi:hypothetical protein